jgi:hypothetical protein
VKKNLYIVLLLLAVGCQQDHKNQETNKEEIVYDMYTPSEMSLLMNSMYNYNAQLKQDILNGETPTEFPENFLEIYSAELSEFKSRNEVFQGFSKLFIEKQKAIFNSNTSLSVTQRYNEAINLCISCHTTECTGPIPKIKKLLIQ